MITFTALFDISFLGLIFFTSLLLSLLLTPVSSHLALALGMVDIPDARKVHSEPRPRCGGMAFGIAFLLSIQMCIKPHQLVTATVLGSVLALALGMIDDRNQISPRVKFVGQVGLITVFLTVSQVHLTGLGDLLGLGDIRFYQAGPVLTAICMLGVINAFNLSDGLDGLAAGLSAIACLFLAILAFEYQHWYTLSILIALFGALIGFLRYNQHPAKLFMGDTGSLLLGFVLSAAAISLSWAGPRAARPVPEITICLMVWVPIVDTIWVMGHRLAQGHHPFVPDKGHLHHRLLALRLPHGAVVTIMYSLAILFCFVGWLLRTLPEWFQFGLAAGMTILLYLSLNLLERSGLGYLIGQRVSRGWGKVQVQEDLQRLSEHSVPVIRPIFVLALLWPGLAILPLPPLFALLCLAAVLLIGAVYPWHGGAGRLPVAHGVLFAACFFLLLLYNFSASRPDWLPLYINVLTVFAFGWAALRIVFKRQDQVFLPSSFELLLLLVAWFVPLVLGSTLGFDQTSRILLIWTCVQVIPVFGLLKFLTRPTAKENRDVALSFGFVFLILMGSTLIKSM